MKFSFLMMLIILVFSHCANTDETNSDPKKDSNIEQVIDARERSDEDVLVFQRKNEPRENAFSLLVPKNWQIDGGIYRVNPLTQGGPSQSIAAKIDFTVKKDNNGTVMIRWLPDVLYFDARYSPAGQMGLFPEGSNYQGMTVYNLMSAETFIRRIAFPYAHPNALNIKIIETKKLADVANKYLHRVKQAMPYATMSYNAALVKFNYSEGNETV